MTYFHLLRIIGEKMDLLQRCASVFNRLTDYQYRFTLGRKGKLKEIVLGFGETDFHHLAGLHKLKDINIARKTDRLFSVRFWQGFFLANVIHKC